MNISVSLGCITNPPSSPFPITCIPLTRDFCNLCEDLSEIDPPLIFVDKTTVPPTYSLEVLEIIFRNRIHYV